MAEQQIKAAKKELFWSNLYLKSCIQ